MLVLDLGGSDAAMVRRGGCWSVLPWGQRQIKTEERGGRRCYVRLCALHARKSLPHWTDIWCPDCHLRAQIYHLCWLQCSHAHSHLRWGGINQGVFPSLQVFEVLRVFLEILKVCLTLTLVCGWFFSQALLCTLDKKTGEKSQQRPRFIKQDQIAIVRLEVTGGMICLETFKDFPQMGRFTLRDEGEIDGTWVFLFYFNNLCESSVGAFHFLSLSLMPLLFSICRQNHWYWQGAQSHCLICLYSSTDAVLTCYSKRMKYLPSFSPSHSWKEFSFISAA